MSAYQGLHDGAQCLAKRARPHRSVRGTVLMGMVVVAHSAMGQASERTVSGGVAPQSGATLDLSGCSAHLVLRQGASAQAPRWLSADAVQQSHVAKVVPNSGGWMLLCSETLALQPQPQVASGVFVNRAVGPGAVAVQNIGGRSSTSRGGTNAPTQASSKPLELEVPAGTRLAARSWSGMLDALSGPWLVDLEIAAGAVKLGSVRNARLLIDAGEVTVGEARGGLHVQLRGAGNLNVARMVNTALDLTLSGVGSMELKGQAATAQVRATGVGRIEIERVRAEPVIEASGVVDVLVGR